jgi:hypothetical protein
VSSTAACERASVNILRLEAVYVVPRGHPAPDDLRKRLDHLARKQLAESCQRILTRALDPKDPSVWFIRHLDVGLALDAGALESDPVAEAWAAHVSKSLVQTVARGPDAESVVYFPDRPAYLAQFVRDLAEGRAWSKWYYEDSLRSLPTGHAIAQAFTREPQHAAATLGRLIADGGFEKFLKTLSEPDARMVYGACFTFQPSRSTARRAAVDSVLAAWPVAFSQFDGFGAADCRGALCLLATLYKSSPDLAFDAELRSAIDNLGHFAQLLSKVAEPEALARKLAAGDLKSALEIAILSGASNYTEPLLFVEGLGRNDVVWMRKLVGTVGRATTTPINIRGATDAGSRSFVTPFGGVFLLLPSLLDHSLDQIINEAPCDEPPEVSQSALLRLTTLLKLVGGDRALDAIDDPAVLLAAGLEKPVARDSLKAMSELATAKMNLDCMRRLTKLTLRLGFTTSRYLSLESVVTQNCGRVLLLRDLERDIWLGAAPFEDNIQKTKEKIPLWLEWIEPVVETTEGCLFIGPTVENLIDAATVAQWNGAAIWLEARQPSALRPIRLISAPAQETGWVSESFRMTPEAIERALKTLRKARPPELDLDYLSLSRSDELGEAIVPNAEFDLVWSLVARVALRGFARRLMGFGQSSPKYLRDNFFSGISTIHFHGSTMSVELPSCPLAVVLNIAGVNGQVYSVPWLGDMQVKLSLPPG